MKHIQFTIHLKKTHTIQQLGKLCVNEEWRKCKIDSNENNMRQSLEANVEYVYNMKYEPICMINEQ